MAVEFDKSKVLAIGGAGGAKGAFEWGKGTGDITDQADLQQVLASKLDASALSSNLTYYMTQAATDVPGYMRLVMDVHDADYPPAYEVVESNAIGANEIAIGTFITDNGTKAQHHDNLTLTVSGQARKADAGTANVMLRFEVWVRKADNTEYMIGESGSVPVTIAQFADLHASALIPHVEFELGDRLVLKYFASRFGTGSNPKIRYRLGGEDPMRALLPLPITAMLPDFGDAAYKNTGTTSNTVAAGDDSRFSDIAGKVNKTGDSMHGNLIFQVPNNASTGFQFSSEKNPYGFSVEVFTDAAGNMTNAYIGYADSGISINPSGNVWIGGSVGADGGFSGTVPNTRKVNNKRLNADITLDASDVGAEPAFAKNSAFNKDFGTTSGTVAAGDHTHALEVLSDTNIPTPQDGAALVYDALSGKWVNALIGIAGLKGSDAATFENKALGAWTLAGGAQQSGANYVFGVGGVGSIEQTVTGLEVGADYYLNFTLKHSVSYNGSIFVTFGDVTTECRYSSTNAQLVVVSAVLSGSSSNIIFECDSTTSGTITVSAISLAKLKPANTVVRSATDQNNNIILEQRALIKNNTANGVDALRSNTTGHNNTASGLNALRSNTVGYNNTANGVDALRSNTTGYNNTASGLNALFSNTVGYNNTASGLNALRSNTTGYNNTASGLNALFSNTVGYSNTASGLNALRSNTVGLNNTANGVDALRSNTTGYNNTASGLNALFSNTVGYSNTASGLNALFSNTVGYSNTASGYNAGRYYSTGNDNNTNPSNGVYIGFDSRSSGDNQSNEIVIGASAVGNGTNTATVGNSNIVLTVLPGQIKSIKTYGATTASASNLHIASNGEISRSTSSIRYKHSVETLDTALADAVVNGARPVWYRSKCEADPANWGFYGLIAEELAEIDPRLVHWGYPKKQVIEIEATPEEIQEDGTITPATEAIYKLVPDTNAELIAEGVQYDRLTVMLLSYIQRLEKRVAALESTQDV